MVRVNAYDKLLCEALSGRVPRIDGQRRQAGRLVTALLDV